PHTANAYNELALTLLRQNQLDEAEKWYRKALEIQTRIGQEFRPSHAWQRSDFALVLRKQGKREEAEIRYHEALGMTRKSGDDHKDLPKFLSELASVLREDGKPAEARPLSEEAVALCLRYPQEVDVRFQNLAFATLKDVLTDLNDITALETLELQRLQNLRLRLLPGDPELATALAELTRKLIGPGKFAEAEGPARECLAICEQGVSDEWRTCNARIMLGGCLL